MEGTRQVENFRRTAVEMGGIKYLRLKMLTGAGAGVTDWLGNGEEFCRLRREVRENREIRYLQSGDLAGRFGGINLQSGREEPAQAGGGRLITA